MKIMFVGSLMSLPMNSCCEIKRFRTLVITSVYTSVYKSKLDGFAYHNRPPLPHANVASNDLICGIKFSRDHAPQGRSILGFVSMNPLDNRLRRRVQTIVASL